MREGLAREFPAAVRGLAWLRGRAGERRAPFWNEPAVWAAISGVGAGFLVTSIVQTLVGLANEGVQALRLQMPFTLFPLVTLSASAAAAAVALAAGGPVALALDLAYVALGVALRIPGTMTFCERFSPQLGYPDVARCTPLSFLASLWPQFVGIGLGVLIARAIASRGNGMNSLLRIAGAFALGLAVVSYVYAATDAETTSTLASGLTFAAGAVAAAVTAGAVAAQLPRSVRNAAIVAGIWLLPWLALQLPALRSLDLSLGADYVGPVIVGVVVQPIAAASLVLSAAVAKRSRFIPRDPA